MHKLLSLLTGGLSLFLFSCSSSESKSVEDDNKKISEERRLEGEEKIARGEYLLTVGGCADCHSPKKFGPHGPIIDSSRMYSGHPAGSPLPPPSASALQPGQWMQMAPDITAFVGPWGISYAANLSPDSATGIGAWTEEAFIKAMKTGKHLGLEGGRPIMPPMPWENLGKLKEEDLSAIFAYLKSIPAINNKVPEPKAPSEVKTL